MNIAETSTAMSQHQVQQEVGVRLLRMNMDNSEQQAQAITDMARESGRAVEQAVAASGERIAVQDMQLGNRIDITV
ncbi:MAG TPA: putative motility protein [Sediminispirochaeta sp.]|nr:putative motility protein [Sediminispirochaeta sp.]